MTYIVEVLPRARNDILKTVDWLTSYSPQGAQVWLNAFGLAREDLRKSAGVYPLLPQSRRLGMRIYYYLFHTPQGRNYQIFYGIDETLSLVRIYRVQSPGQRPLRRKDLL